MKLIANFFSILLLPLFMPLYGLLLTLYIYSVPENFDLKYSLYYLTPEHKLTYIKLFLIFTVGAPILSLVWLKINGSISSFGLEKKEERKYPIAITSLYFFLMFAFLFYQQNGMIPEIILATCFGAFISSILCLVISTKTKISLHAMGAGSLLGFIIAYFQTQSEFSMWIVYLCIALGVITTVSRLILDKHTLKQISLGYGLGFFVQLITIFIYSQA